MIGFTRIERGGKVALARNECAEAIADALIDGSGCAPTGKKGRGTVMRFVLVDGPGIIRRYQRGGAAQRLMRDAYVLSNRPLREFLLHRHLLDGGLPVPQLLGVCWWRRGPLYRGAIATAELDAMDLLAYLQSTPEAWDTLRACGALIRRMHELRLWHADLQLKNILVGSGSLYLIDFDKATLANRLTAVQRARNLFRLRRSLEKHGFPPSYFEAICAGYGPLDLPGWLDRAYRTKGRWSDWSARKRRQ